MENINSPPINRPDCSHLCSKKNPFLHAFLSKRSRLASQRAARRTPIFDAPNLHVTFSTASFNLHSIGSQPQANLTYICFFTGSLQAMASHDSYDSYRPSSTSPPRHSHHHHSHHSHHSHPRAPPPPPLTAEAKTTIDTLKTTYKKRGHFDALRKDIYQNFADSVGFARRERDSQIRSFR